LIGFAELWGQWYATVAPIFMTYQQYLEKTKQRLIAPLVQKALPFIPPHSLVLDLGCGAGVETEALARLGHRVVAVDKEQASIELVRKRCQGLPVTCYQTRIENFDIPEKSFDVIIALQSLPFLNEKNFFRAIRSVESGIKLGGFMVMRLFGVNDDWVKKIG